MEKSYFIFQKCPKNVLGRELKVGRYGYSKQKFFNGIRKIGPSKIAVIIPNLNWAFFYHRVMYCKDADSLYCKQCRLWSDCAPRGAVWFESLFEEQSDLSRSLRSSDLSHSLRSSLIWVTPWGAVWFESLLEEQSDLSHSLRSSLIWVYETCQGGVIPYLNTVMILSFRTNMPGQTVQTQIRLLLEEQSDQDLHCLPFRMHYLDSLLYGRIT